LGCATSTNVSCTIRRRAGRMLRRGRPAFRPNGARRLKPGATPRVLRSRISLALKGRNTRSPRALPGAAIVLPRWGMKTARTYQTVCMCNWSYETDCCHGLIAEGANDQSRSRPNMHTPSTTRASCIHAAARAVPANACDASGAPVPSYGSGRLAPIPRPLTMRTSSEPGGEDTTTTPLPLRLRVSARDHSGR